MNKLQIIKEDYRIHEFGLITSPENFNWLIEQAEKLEQLKEILKDNSDNKNNTYNITINRYGCIDKSPEVLLETFVKGIKEKLE